MDARNGHAVCGRDGYGALPRNHHESDSGRVYPILLRLGHHPAAVIASGTPRPDLAACGFSWTAWPIAEVTALGFTTPIFATLGAALFLNERFRSYRLVVILVGFLGALLILRPGFRVIDIGAFAQLAAAPLFACSYLMVKSATHKESSAMIVVLLSIFCTLTLAAPALWVWRPPTLHELMLLATTAMLATAGHYCMTRALAAAEVSAVQPFTFLQLVWATLFGLILFDEHPDFWIWIGGAVIVGAATWMAQKEVRALRSEARSP
jgi:drug/metabolite transporter (DMT)-like permease